MSIHLSQVLLAIAGRLRGRLDLLLDRLEGRRRGLDRTQRAFLLGGFREELQAQVEDAEESGLSDYGVRRLALTRAIIRWLERDEPPGPEAVPHFERLLAAIQRNPGDYELAERRAFAAAIYDLGGDDRAAADIWMEPDPRGLAVFGRCFHRFMREADLTVAEVAEEADLEPSAVVAFLTGMEEPRTTETLNLAGAVGVPGEVLFEALEAEYLASGRPGRDRGLNSDVPTQAQAG
ncbi:MAG TPA: hypothetical protein VHZ54_14125 [Solirubrobacterales bacterium]|nr:hypothetical protein [Solirubrobacterales bacterium]